LDKIINSDNTRMKTIVLLLVTSISFEGVEGVARINLKPRRDNVSSSPTSKSAGTSDTGAHTSISDILTVDLSGKSSTHLLTPKEAPSRGSTSPVFRFGTVRMMPDVFIGTSYDLSGGLRNALKRLSSRLVWSTVSDVKDSGGLTLFIENEKGLIQDNDYATSLGINGMGNRHYPQVKIRYEFLRKRLSMDASASVSRQVRLLAKTSVFFDRSVPDRYFHYQIPKTSEESDGWIPNFRLLGNGDVICRSEIGLRRISPVGIRIGFRKNINLGSVIGINDDEQNISLEFCSSNKLGNALHSVKVESSLDNEFLSNLHTTLTLENVISATM